MKVSDEIRLLLNCIQLHPNKTVIKNIDSISRRSIDWKLFTDAALWHGLAPLAYNGLKNCQDRNGVPAEYFEKLKSIYLENLVRNTIIFAEFEKIAGVLGKSNIPIVALKGAGFAKMIYKDIGLRPMSDIDILIKLENLGKTIQAIETIGYFLSKGESLENKIKTDYHIQILNPETNVLLEIHWNISCKKNPSLVCSKAENLMDSWWSRVSQASAVEPVNVYHLHPVDLICLLSAHFFKHRFINRNAGFSTNGSLLQLFDILNIIRFYSGDIFWDELKAESLRIGLYSVISVIIHVMKNVFFEILFDCDFFFKNADGNPSDQVIAQYLIKRIFAMNDKDSPVPIAFIHKPKNVSLLGHINDIYQKAFPDPETFSRKLNHPIDSTGFCFNYLYRAFFLFKKYGRVYFQKKWLKEEDVLRRWINELG